MSVLISYEMPLAQLSAEIHAEEARIAAAMNETRDDLLKLIENSQIKSYTATGNPTQPSGTRYRRTFNLQGASETEVTGRTLPEISGVWRVNEGKAPYGGYVLGKRQDQAAIHRGRWESLEDVEKEANDAAPRILQEKLKR